MKPDRVDPIFIESPKGSQNPGDITRREYLSTIGVITGCVALESAASPLEAATTHTAPTFELTINGQPHRFQLDPRVTLLDLLRNHLNLTGTKKGCDHGQCGACTVLANGRRINSCLALAVVHDGEEITTVEGLARGERLDPIQAAFIEHDALQCGYCTPGQLCSAVAMLGEAKQGDASFITQHLGRLGPVELSADEIRERMSGNICRCGAYPGIVAALTSKARTVTG